MQKCCTKVGNNYQLRVFHIILMSFKFGLLYIIKKNHFCLCTQHFVNAPL